ncbi:MAG TPA: DedA family protein [Gammaproteobacteria bacterium]|nr:DedA family protein [Gammaproteobacteria bacterium]
MEFISQFADIVLHLDQHLYVLVSQYGIWVYGILCLIIFSETGFVVTPFLPGDSLLFAAGAIAATGALEALWLFVLLSLAAILGNTANYAIGHLLGPKIFSQENSRLLNRKHLDRAHAFYEKYGGKAIIISRFLPVIRTFAPFVAGIGRMAYGYFQLYNTAGGVLWVGSLVYVGYLFGNVPWIKNNFSMVILAIIIISLLPAVIEFIRQRALRDKT